MTSRIRGIEIQDRLVETIDRLHQEQDIWPSQRTVRDALNLKRSTARYHILVLEDLGRIERLEGGRILRLPTPEVKS